MTEGAHRLQAEAEGVRLLQAGMKGTCSSRLGWKELGDFRLRSMTQPQVVRCGSRIQGLKELSGVSLGLTDLVGSSL